MLQASEVRGIDISKYAIKNSHPKVKRNLTDKEIEQNKLSANHYIENFKVFNFF